LGKRGLPTEGLKAELINRLQARLDEEEFGMVDAPAAGATAATVAAAAAATGKSPPAAAAAPVPATKPKPTSPAAPASTPTAKPTITTDAATAKETATPVPAAAVVVDAGAVASPPASNGAALSSFEDQKRKRAERFGIAVVASPTIKKDSSKRAAAKDATGTPKGKNQKQEKGGEKVKEVKAAAVPEKAKEAPLLPKAEIEKRLHRAERFGGITDAKKDELKAMLRKHRFNEANGQAE
jgi:hypothetical protein